MTLSLFFAASRSMWPPALERGASKPRGTSPFGLVAAPGSSAGRRPGVSRSRSLIAGSHRVRNTGRKRDHLAGPDPLLSPCIQLEDELALQDHRDLVRLVRVALEPRPRLHLEPREHHALARSTCSKPLLAAYFAAVVVSEIGRPRSEERRQGNRPFVQGRADPLAAYVGAYRERAEQGVLPGDLDGDAADQPP